MEAIFLWVAVCWIVYRSLDPLNLEEIREMKEEHNGDSSRNLFPIRLEGVISFVCDLETHVAVCI